MSTNQRVKTYTCLFISSINVFLTKPLTQNKQFDLSPSESNTYLTFGLYFISGDCLLPHGVTVTVIWGQSSWDLVEIFTFLGLRLSKQESWEFLQAFTRFFVAKERVELISKDPILILGGRKIGLGHAARTIFVHHHHFFDPAEKKRRIITG